MVMCSVCVPFPSLPIWSTEKATNTCPIDNIFAALLLKLELYPNFWDCFGSTEAELIHKNALHTMRKGNVREGTNIYIDWLCTSQKVRYF